MFSLCCQITADVVACAAIDAAGERQVRGYERTEHGKLEYVRAHERQIPEVSQRWLGPLGPHVYLTGPADEAAGKMLNGLYRLPEAVQRRLASTNVSIHLRPGDSIPLSELSDEVNDLGKQQGLVSIAGYYNPDRNSVDAATGSASGTELREFPASHVLTHELMHALDNNEDGHSGDPEWRQLDGEISHWYESSPSFFRDQHFDHRVVGHDAAMHERYAELAAQHLRDPGTPGGAYPAPFYLGEPLPGELARRVHRFMEGEGLHPRPLPKKVKA